MLLMENVFTSLTLLCMIVRAIFVGRASLILAIPDFDYGLHRACIL